MAKLTIATLQPIVNAVLDASKIAADSPFVPTYDAITGLVSKIGKQLMLEYNFEDKLPELDSEVLSFGQTVEEYFVDLVLPVAADGDGSTTMAPKRPAFETVAYSYALAQKDFPVTIDAYKMQGAMAGQAEYAALVSYITKTIYDALIIYRYFLKKGAIGRLIDMLAVAGVNNKQVVVLAKPADTVTAEAFAKSVKDKYEAAINIHDNLNLRGVVAASSPSDLILYVKEGIRSVLDVDLEAGTFNVGKVQVPVTVKALEDFGTLSVHTNAYALLVDTRGIKVFTDKNTVSSQYNGQGEFTTFWLHYIPTVHISKVINAVIWETA